jgi:hypothetical protein
MTTANTTTTLNERMRIDQSGYVGIGTSSPSSPLTVAGEIKSTSGGLTSTEAGTGTLQITAGSAPTAPANGDANVFVNSTSGIIQCQYGASQAECIPTYNYTSNALGADVTMTTAFTYYDGPSVTLAAGTWMVQGTITAYTTSTTSAVMVACKLWDGTTISSSTGASSGAVAVAAQRLMTMSLQGIVSPASPTTYKISCTSTVNSQVIRASLPSGGTGNTTSTVWAFRLK